MSNFIAGNNLRFAGDVTINRATLVSSKGVYLNVTGQVLAVRVYEDIFSPFITGVLVLKESFDLQNLLPLIGEEYIKLDIDSKIARIYYFAYSTVIDDYFPQHNYVEVLNAEREVHNAFHNLIFLGISDNEEKIQSDLIAKFEEIYKKINIYLVNFVNNKNLNRNTDGSSNLNSRSGFLPHPDEPSPIPADFEAYQMLRN